MRFPRGLKSNTWSAPFSGLRVGITRAFTLAVSDAVREVHHRLKPWLCRPQREPTTVGLRHQAAQIQSQPNSTGASLAGNIGTVERLGQLRPLAIGYP